MGEAQDGFSGERAGVTTSDDLVGGRYRLMGELGQGAMGVVWRAYDIVLDRQIAIKELRPNPGIDRAEALDRFLVEARAAARLSHPNIVGVHDAFVDGDRVLIAMELIEGQTLDQLVSTSGAQRPAQVRAIMAQVAQALYAAHQMGVIHRDLKPDNIFWTAEGRAVVGDFGLARIGAGRGTVDGTVMGTPGYMAPEQVKGTVTSAATDVFGWGAVAYELASGEAPFGEPSFTDPSALAYRIVHQDHVPLELPDDPRLAAVVNWAMRKSPDDRPADGGQLIAALLVEGAPIADPPVSAPAPAPAPLRETGRPRARRKVAALTGAGAALAVAVLAILLGGGSGATKIVVVPANTAQAPESTVTTVTAPPEPTTTAPPTTEAPPPPPAPPPPEPEPVDEPPTTVARTRTTSAPVREEPVVTTRVTSPPTTAAPAAPDTTVPPSSGTNTNTGASVRVGSGGSGSSTSGGSSGGSSGGGSSGGSSGATVGASAG